MARNIPTLFYDAGCTLCTMWKEWMAASGWRSVRFANANDSLLAREMGVSDVEQLKHRMCLLMPDGREAWGYDALVQLLRLSDASDGIAAAMSLRPLATIGRWLYERIAQSRSCAAG